MGALNGYMAVSDIDGTQVREDIPVSEYSTDDLADIQALNDYIEDLIAEGLVFVHSTNRMTHLYAADQDSDNNPGLLVRPNYATTSASTEVLECNRETGELSPNDGFATRLAEIDYDKEKIVADVQALVDQGILVWSSEGDQTQIKTSAHFNPDIPVAEREKIRDQLQSKQAEGVSVFMVEDPETHIIDIMPEICTKHEIIGIIADQEGIASENIFVAGNSNNDISMFQPERAGVAVSSAKDSLKDHVAEITGAFGDAINNRSRLTVAPKGLSPAQSVLWGLKSHFEPILKEAELTPAA